MGPFYQGIHLSLVFFPFISCVEMLLAVDLRQSTCTHTIRTIRCRRNFWCGKRTQETNVFVAMTATAITLASAIDVELAFASVLSENAVSALLFGLFLFLFARFGLLFSHDGDGSGNDNNVMKMVVVMMMILCVYFLVLLMLILQHHCRCC